MSRLTFDLQMKANDLKHFLWRSFGTFCLFLLSGDEMIHENIKAEAFTESLEHKEVHLVLISHRLQLETRH